MTELKTLKNLDLFQIRLQDVMGGRAVILEEYPDILKSNGFFERLKLEKTFVNVEDLRQEAIKWIKALQKFEYEDENKIPDHLKPFYYCEDVHEGEFHLCEISVKWIKHFFNIKESELE